MKSPFGGFFFYPRISILFAAVLAVTFFTGTALGSTISNTDKFAWSENVAWINFKPTGGGAGVQGDHLTGYVWSESAGWIKLGVDAGGPYANTTTANWGVNQDVSGALSGYGWSENAAWINFNPTGGGVVIDGATGDFSGYAWSESLGWICFKGDSPAYKVKTDLSGQNQQTSTGVTSGGGSGAVLKDDGTVLQGWTIHTGANVYSGVTIASGGRVIIDSGGELAGLQLFGTIINCGVITGTSVNPAVLRAGLGPFKCAPEAACGASS